MAGFINTMLNTGIRLKLPNVIHDTVLSDSISSEMKTSELPEYYRAAVPFVKNYILYIHKTKTAHSPNGKIQINGIVRDFDISCEQFRSILETYKSKSCFALSELSGEGLPYVVPMHIGSTKETTQWYCQALDLLTKLQISPPL